MAIPSQVGLTVLLSVFLLGIVIYWLWVRRGKAMSRLPFGVGDAEAQARFIKTHEKFLEEYLQIRALLEKVFLRPLPTSERAMPLASPTEIEDRNMADGVVFFLGRAAADDFGELLVLAGNGRGIGAYKILRGMYERIVTAAFISKNAPEARLFLSHSFIERDKVWRRFKELIPDYPDNRKAEDIAAFEQELGEAKARLKESICKKCNQPISQEAWTRKTLDVMAEKADGNLARAYAYCYLMPTLHSHATAFSMESRMRWTEAGYSFKEITEEEARKAVLYGHGLILRLLKLENGHFGLELDAEVEERWRAFPEIWKQPEGV